MGFWMMEARKIVRVARVRPIGLDDHNANCAYFESIIAIVTIPLFPLI